MRCLIIVSLLVICSCAEDFLVEEEVSLVVEEETFIEEKEEESLECYSEINDSNYFVSESLEMSAKLLTIEDSCGEYTYLVQQAIDDLNYIVRSQVLKVKNVCNLKECWDEIGDHIIRCRHSSKERLGEYNGGDIWLYQSTINFAAEKKGMSINQMFLSVVKHELVHLLSDDPYTNEHSDNSKDVMYSSAKGTYCYSNNDISVIKSLI